MEVGRGPSPANCCWLAALVKFPWCWYRGRGEHGGNFQEIHGRLWILRQKIGDSLVVWISLPSHFQLWKAMLQVSICLVIVLQGAEGYLDFQKQHPKFSEKLAVRLLKTSQLKKNYVPASSKWPFDHPNGGHLAILNHLNPWKGHLKHPKRSQGRTW